MSAKTSKKPVIGVLTGTFISGGAADFATSPRTQSPRGLKSYDSGVVGLGIVAALEKSAGGGSDIPALFGRNFSRSSPIPVKSSSTNRGDPEEMEVGSLEEYTIVTRHGQNKSDTKVYSDTAEVGRKGDDRTPFRIQSTSKATVFHISPPRFGDATASPPSDFLSACDLCRKKLHGKDIYMYRGEKAFCSSECRYRQIVVDERKEKCSAEASRPAAAAAEVAGSPYSSGQMFTTGILAI